MRDAQKDAASSNAPDVAESARSVIAAGQTMHRLEAAALASDPKATDAQAALSAANAKVAAMRADFDKSLKSDPDWLAAKKALDDARQKLASAGR